MEVTGIITAIVIGAIVGVLGRLVVPGKQAIGIVLTIVVGIVAALLGLWLAEGLMTNPGWFIVLLIQVVLAAIGVAIVAGVMGRRA